MISAKSVLYGSAGGDEHKIIEKLVDPDRENRSEIAVMSSMTSM